MVFDLDGTLIDSFPGIASAYHHVLTSLQLGDIEDADIRQLIGPPIQEVLRSRFGLTGDRLDEGVRTFRSHYGSEGLYRYTKYEGIDKMLQALDAADFQLCIATSKLTTMATEIVDHAGWQHLFPIVGGALPDGSRYLKADVVAWTMAQLGADTGVIAMVGDRGADMQGGLTNGLPGIGVTWGYGSDVELQSSGAYSIIDRPGDLLLALRRLPPSK